MSKAIVLGEKDNVATALGDIAMGESVELRGGDEGTVSVLQVIPFGHKFAIRDISKGEEVLKYGEVIARATQDIKKGEHVHVHNVESLRGRGDLVEGES